MRGLCALILWLSCLFISVGAFLSLSVQRKSSTLKMANPVTFEGSNYRGDITEQEAFLWFDEAFVHVRAGSGGAGSNAVKFGKARQHMAPTGGSGGNGGSVIFTVDPSFNTLLGFRGQSGFRADNGADGDLEYANGVSGRDFRVAVPKGTVVIDNSTNVIIGELTRERQELVVARGGMGGGGNAALNGAKGKVTKCTPSEGGERRWLKLELKLVADVGLVGVPNAGKSTLLDAITNARPKIAPYPFTTIVPNLGVCEVGGSLANGGFAMVIADIPGLLEGAHRGVGLGRGFLRHVERCKMIIHIVNGDAPSAIQDFDAINRELQLFSPTLAAKPQVVVLNKIDISHVAEKQAELMAALRGRMTHARLLSISAAGRVGTDDLVERTFKFLQKVKADEAAVAQNSRGGRTEESRVVTGMEGRLVDDDVDVDESGGVSGRSMNRNEGGICTDYDIRVENDSTVLLSGRSIEILSEETAAAAGGSRERVDAMVEALNLAEKVELTLLAYNRKRGAGDLSSGGIAVKLEGNMNRFIIKHGKLLQLSS